MINIGEGIDEEIGIYFLVHQHNMVFNVYMFKLENRIKIYFID